MNPGYLAVALVLGAAFVSTSSALAATTARDAAPGGENPEGQRMEMRRGFDVNKSLLVGTVMSISGSSLTVTPRSIGTSTVPVSFVVDTTNASIIRVTKALDSVNPATTTVTASSIGVGELVSVTGTRDEVNHTVIATEVRVGEFVAMFGRGGDMRNDRNGSATSTEMKRPGMSGGDFSSKKNASTTVSVSNQHNGKANIGFWQKFKGFLGFN